MKQIRRPVVESSSPAILPPVGLAGCLTVCDCDTTWPLPGYPHKPPVSQQSTGEIIVDNLVVYMYFVYLSCLVLSLAAQTYIAQAEHSAQDKTVTQEMSWI